MDKLVLKDGTKIDLVAGASLGALQIESESRETMLEIWKKLTDENLKLIRIETSEDIRRKTSGRIGRKSGDPG